MPVFRVLCTVLLVQVLIQAALAGGFITGDVAMLEWHNVNAALLVLNATLLVVAAGLIVWPGRGPWWPIAFTSVFWLCVAAQLGFGYARLIGLHIPLGMAIMGLIAGLTWWSYARRGVRA